MGMFDWLFESATEKKEKSGKLIDTIEESSKKENWISQTLTFITQGIKNLFAKELNIDELIESMMPPAPKNTYQTSPRPNIFSRIKTYIFGAKQEKVVVNVDQTTENTESLRFNSSESTSLQQAKNLAREQKIYGKDGIKYKGEAQSPHKSDNTPNSQNKERSNSVVVEL